MIIIFEDFKEVQSEIEYSVGETVICIKKIKMSFMSMLLIKKHIKLQLLYMPIDL